MKNVYFSVQNFHGGRPIRREVDTAAEAHALAKETPDAVVSALHEGWLIKDWHFSAKHEIPSLGKFEEMVRAGIRSYEVRHKNPTRRKGNPRTVFSAAQLNALRREFEGIETVNPKRLEDFHRIFAGLGDAGIKQLANARIKFVSPLARNELTRRKGPKSNPTGDTCNTCGRAAGSPYRIFDARGKVIAGCVDDFHTGHLVTPSESSFWHNRPEAKKIRAILKKGRAGKGYRGNPMRKKTRSAAQQRATAKMLAANRARKKQLRAFSKVVGHPSLSTLAREGAAKLRAVRKARGKNPRRRKGVNLPSHGYRGYGVIRMQPGTLRVQYMASPNTWGSSEREAMSFGLQSSAKYVAQKCGHVCAIVPMGPGHTQAVQEFIAHCSGKK